MRESPIKSAPSNTAYSSFSETLPSFSGCLANADELVYASPPAAASSLFLSVFPILIERPFVLFSISLSNYLNCQLQLMKLPDVQVTKKSYKQLINLFNNFKFKLRLSFSKIFAKMIAFPTLCYSRKSIGFTGSSSFRS